jgi:hypothetical protein
MTRLFRIGPWLALSAAFEIGTAHKITHGKTRKPEHIIRANEFLLIESACIKFLGNKFSQTATGSWMYYELPDEKVESNSHVMFTFMTRPQLYGRPHKNTYSRFCSG